MNCKHQCENKCCENKFNSLYIKKIIKQIGPVILGSKPSEIVNIPGKINEKQKKLKEIECFFDNCSRVKYKIITTKDGGKRVLFTNEKTMEETLSNKKIRNFLNFLGYPKSNTLKEYIDELAYRLESSEFPHEIGVFLGYPLKDVLGFMGYSNKECACVCSWRVYGDKEVSTKVYNSFIRDKKQMENMVNKLSLVELKYVIA